jgi:putative hydrolase of the HAD superfamily
VAPLLGRLRLLGTRTAVVSNWDVSLWAILSELGLGGLFDEVVVSAEAGVTKPGKDIFELALQRLGSPARKALFVGDSLETDVAGALGAGIRGVLLDRAGNAAVEPGVERIFTLEAVGELVAPPPAALRA